MNGQFYLAGGEGPHPTLVLLHGFPGNEQIFDLAQAPFDAPAGTS
jgi:pimeloyl-ACP methyl ester carboxylesterase